MLRTSRRDRRRGNILIVTLALLALMAIVGLTAVYYTKDQAERARIQGQPKGGGEGFSVDGTASATHFLRTLLYDEQDYGTGLLNSARGHSLVATMYGRQPGAYIAWNGPGTFGGASIAQFNSVDRRQMVNHRLFPGLNVCDPEWSGERPATTPTAWSPTPTGYVGTYYGKNPPYTYPDIKDFALASLCPATGEVLVPSFHREAAFGPLAPSNPNWLAASPQGKFLTLRPRPAEHPNFPPIPANADGSFTGDVQNLPGGFYNITAPPGGTGIAHNDSIWIDTGLAPITLPNGRKIKPLIAPLILDLDGRLNLNVHGNVMNGGAHASGQGFGPWEVNLSKVLTTDATSIVTARGTLATRSGLTTKAFAPRLGTLPNNQIPRSAQVAWAGFNAANPLQLPTFTPLPPLVTPNPFSTASAYAGGYDATNTALSGHPSLYNPYEWIGATGTTKAFPFTDSKILSLRYAPYRYDASQLSFAASANTSLVGTALLPNPNPPHQGTNNPYRTDLAHANRMVTTTMSNALHRSMLMPGYDSTKTPPSLPSDPNASVPSTTNAYLGAIDLNRPLADYRNDTTQPLSATNATNAVTADTDRQTFAKDIFVRLVAASANPATEARFDPVTSNVTVVAASGSTEYNTVRSLAQLAANIVDYIDSDDVSTRFAWNSAVATEVVYGVEQPRLVINEAYAEITNDPADMAFVSNMNTASNAAHVRFWVELQNPSMRPHTTTSGGPLGDGAVAFGAKKPYKLEIVRNEKIAAAPNVIGRLRPTTPADAAYPSNATGDLGVAPDITFDFGVASATSVPAADGAVGGGMVVCAADVPSKSSLPSGMGPEYKPAAAFANQITATAVPNAIGGSTTAMAYPITLPMNPDTEVPATFSRHVIALRRLANPYLDYEPTNNPYITVDVLDHVRAADRIVLPHGRRTNEAMMPRPAKTMTAAGYETDPQSVGKVQPYASFAAPMSTTTAATTISAYPATTMVVQQDAAAADGVKHTLSRQNSKAGAPSTTTAPPTDTMVAPFDWFLHLDRPLINQTELLHVSTGRPHDVTYNFVGANNVKFGGAAQAAMLAATATPPYDKLYRAFDLLTVQPFGHQMALGGRVPGRININTIQDQRVWRALFDAQGYNGFDEMGFVDNLWTTLMATRTVNMSTRTDATGTNPAWSCPVPGATVHDTGSATGTPNPDRPFLPFGVATVAAGTGATFNAGVGVNDTLLRINPGTNLPYLTVTSGTHPYQQAEALRKILNNTTTVSHTFAVWITVGYFEVESETASPVGGSFVTLGREYYLNAPGDTRRKFFALVDRSNIGFKPEELPPFVPTPGTPLTQVDHPFFTTIEGTAAIPAGAATIPIATDGTSGYVYSDGVPVQIVANMRLVIGVGANQEIVTVGTPTPTSFTATTTKIHYPGEVVSNIVPGNPGVPTDFDPTATKYKAVVPVWVKLP